MGVRGRGAKLQSTTSNYSSPPGTVRGFCSAMELVLNLRHASFGDGDALAAWGNSSSKGINFGKAVVSGDVR